MFGLETLYGGSYKKGSSSTTNQWGTAPLSPESQFGLEEMKKLYQGYNISPLARMLNGSGTMNMFNRSLSDYNDPMSSESVKLPYETFKAQSEQDLDKTLGGLSGNAARFGVVGSSGDARLKSEAITGQQSTLANLLSQLVLGSRQSGLAGINSFGNMAQLSENFNLTPFTLAMALRNASAPPVQTGSYTKGSGFDLMGQYKGSGSIF